MKTNVSVLLLALGLGGCMHVDTENSVGMTIIRLDAGTSLTVSVGGVQARSGPIEYVPPAKSATPMHRVLHGSDGKVLFAYDLQLIKGAPGGEYRFLLRPAALGPTFEAVREVTVRGHDLVKVELMEEPATGRKVEDIFRLLPAEGAQRGSNPNTAEAHLARIHSFFRQLIHGD
jgi:hypothetical protein